MNPLMSSGPESRHGGTALSVNLNLVAMMRNRRPLPFPSVTRAATVVLEAGAAGITVHPRPDERHIRAGDVHELAVLLKAWPQAEFNIEGYPTEDFLRLVEKNQPEQVTLVPDDPVQATSDHGWDFLANEALLTAICARLRAGGMRVSLFADALWRLIRAVFVSRAKSERALRLR